MDQTERHRQDLRMGQRVRTQNYQNQILLSKSDARIKRLVLRVLEGPRLH